MKDRHKETNSEKRRIIIWKKHGLFVLLVSLLVIFGIVFQEYLVDNLGTDYSYGKAEEFMIAVNTVGEAKQPNTEVPVVTEETPTPAEESPAPVEETPTPVEETPSAGEVPGTEASDATESTKPAEDTAKFRQTRAAFPPLTSDQAHITNLTIDSISDGTSPWDADSNPGNDADAANKVIRTFDTINYIFTVQMEAYDGSVFGQARTKLEFVLPFTEDQAEFDLGSMGWMDETSGYEPKLTTETRNINSVDTFCQVLTCYKFISKESDPVIPGTFSETIAVKVKSMHNNAEVFPIISAAMEYNTWSDLPCPEDGHGVEKVMIAAVPVKVSAVPKYNAFFAGGHDYKDTFDFNTGNDLAANKNIGTVTGRAFCYGLTIQLYNDNASKGLKGIEMPQGDITFKINVSSAFNPSSGNTVDTTDEYLPLLWSYGGNSYDPNQDEQDTSNAYGQVNYAVPINKGTGNLDCYDGGNFTAVQSGQEITVTIKDYQIDPDKFPTHRAADSGGPVIFPENVGCFSAGEFWIVQPYNKVNSTNTSVIYDVVNDYGDGTFTTAASLTDLSMTSISNQVQEDGAKTNDAQIVKTDDRIANTTALSVPGVLMAELWYTKGYADISRIGVNGLVSEAMDGSDATIPGNEIGVITGCGFMDVREELNRMNYGTSLLRFDAEALEPTGASSDLMTPGFTRSTLYATKPDGTNWIDDDELMATTEEGLVFYSSLEDIPAGHLCVAVLNVFKGPDTSALSSGGKDLRANTGMRIRDDQSLCGNVYMINQITRVCTAQYMDAAGLTADEMPSWLDEDTVLADFPPAYAKNPYWYTKESYDENGMLGTHTGGYTEGDSLLLIGYKAAITKKMEQKISGNTVKDSFNMDQDQRIVDFVLQPSTKLDAEVSTTSKTTVTVIETLPKYLKYIGGSSYFGGTYTQTSAAGGTQGQITGGTLNEPDSVVNNSDGTQTLTWIISDVTIGAELPAIHYAATIGAKGDEANDVPSLATTNLTNKVRIYGMEDNRAPTIANGNYAEVGLTVVRGAASSFAKLSDTPLVDPNGSAGYTILLSNNSAAARDDLVLVDTMPFNGDSRGSHFTGTYHVEKWQLNVDRVTEADLELWYTTDVQYQEKTAKEVTLTEITGGGNWTQMPIAADGTVAAMNGQAPVAWALVGRLGGNETIEVDMTIKLEPTDPEANEKYVNMVSQGEQKTTINVSTVSRTIEGLTWMDEDMDGQQDDNEVRFSGVKVTLLKLKAAGDPANEADYTDVIESIETGRQKDLIKNEETDYQLGRYKFVNVPAGTYAIRFENGSSKITLFTASPTDTVNDAIDSDGVPTYNTATAKLAKTIITNITLPETKNMNVALFESKYHDSGFYEGISYAFTKIQGTDQNKALSGAEFVVYKSVHTHDDTCGGLAADGQCNFIVDQMDGNIFDESVWDITNPVCTASSDDSGKVILNGLGYGVYMLVETKAPAGYQLSNGCWIMDVKPSSNNPVIITGSPISPTAADGQPNAFLKETEDGKDSYFLPNYKKPLFPFSGGRGTIIFTISGVIVVGIAILLFLLTKNRKSKSAMLSKQ